LRGVLQAREKLIDLPLPELYDLAAQEVGARDLGMNDRDRAQVLTNLLRTFNVAPPNRPGQETADAAAALKSLGYVSGSAPAKAAYTEADDPKRLAALDNDLHRATELTEVRTADEAIALLQSVIARRPDTADAYLSLAYIYWEAGQPQPAIDVLERGLSAGAPDRDIRIRLGLYLAESHADARRAIGLLEGLSGEDVEALNGLGVAYGDAGRTADSERTFRRVLALDPTNGMFWVWGTTMLLRQEKVQDAESTLRSALAADPALAAVPTDEATMQAFADTIIPGRRVSRTESGAPVHPLAIAGVDPDPGAVEADTLALYHHPKIGFDALAPALLAELNARSLQRGAPFLALGYDDRVSVLRGALDFANPTRLVFEAGAAVPFTAFCAAALTPEQTAERAVGYRVMGLPGRAPRGYLGKSSYGKRLSRERTKRGYLA